VVVVVDRTVAVAVVRVVLELHLDLRFLLAVRSQ
jgi:hypothetical protein